MEKQEKEETDMGIWAAIKYAMNSTLGTGNFSPLDKIIKDGLSDVDTNVIRLRGGGTNVYQ